MKILQVISGNDNGGGARHVLNICTYSNKVKNEIAFLGCGEFYDLVKKSDVKCELFNVNILNKKFVEFANSNNYDIIDFHGAKAFFLYFLTYKRLNARCTATVHSDYRKDFLNSRFKRIFYTPLSKFGLKKFKNIICVSDYIKELLIKQNIRSNFFVINNGIDFDKINFIKTRDEIRNEINLNEDDFVYVCIARMHPVKNHKRLLLAFQKMVNEYKNAKLLLIGNGQEEQNLLRQACELKIHKNVFFLGYIKDTFDYVNASDISILASLSEGGEPPLVVLESAALKKPVIYSNIGNIETSFKGKMYLTDPYSENDIYLKMREAYLNKNNLKKQAETLYNYCKNNYSVEKFCENYYDAYSKLLK